MYETIGKIIVAILIVIALLVIVLVVLPLLGELLKAWQENSKIGNIIVTTFAITVIAMIVCGFIYFVYSIL